MALVGANDSERRCLFPTLNVFRGGDRFTVGAWCYFSSGTSFYRSVLRMDGTLSPIQVTSASTVLGAWWDASGALNVLSAYGTLGTSIALNRWHYLGLWYSSIAGGIQTFLYTPGGPVVYPSGGFHFTSGIYPFGSQVLHIGAAEGGGEAIDTGWGVAEVSIVSGVLSSSGIRSLAHSPRSFGDNLAFYLPLRTAKRTSEQTRGRSYAMSSGNSFTPAVNGAFHPPVNSKPSSSLYIANTYAARVAASDALKLRASTNGARALFTLG